MESKSIDRIYCDAALIDAPAEREAYLERACGSDTLLRRKVEKFLELRSRAEHFLESSPLAQDVTIDAPSQEGPGAVIGPYKLLQQIGEGGMGVVWMAEQTQPVHRKVALKVIKPGMDSRQVIVRFEAERQALAMMDHVNIARVFDGGATENGLPYFVMELVHGVPITKYCDDNHLTPRERLELFVPVCQAIQHAHQKGIIHRDIKPSNVMVTLYDGKPVPKVIDFGVAKATELKLTERTLFTQYGAMVGTLEYMSPEQAEMSALGVDTRSDIYSLGVLLYELLTGSTPLTHKRMKEAAYAEILRMIKEEEPPKPSTRLSDSGEALASISANRHTEPAKLTKLVRGELDWIVMKCLEKDRSRRYETANGFAIDVQRYLADESVQACPPSAGYRFKKFARRNKRALVMTSVIGVAILSAVGALGWMLRDRQAGSVRTANEVNQFLQRAETLYGDNKLPEAGADVEKARGVLEAGRGDTELARRVRQWLTDLDTAAKLEEIRLESFDQDDRGWGHIDYARVFQDYGIDVEALSTEEATARVAASQIRFDLVLALGNWAGSLRSDPQQDPARWQRLFAIRLAADSDPWQQRLFAAVEAGDVKTLRELADGADPAWLRARTLAHVGHSLVMAGDAEAAVAFLRRAHRQYPGDFLINSTLALSLGQLKPPQWDEAIAFRRVALAARPQSAWAHNTLGSALARKDRLAEAIVEYREALRLRPGNAYIHCNLGIILQRQKRVDEAIASHKKAIELDPKSVFAHNNLGIALKDQKKLDEAIASYKKAIELDPKHISAHINLGNALRDQKKLDEAIISYKKAIEVNPKYVNAHLALGNAWEDHKELGEAVACYKKAIELDPKYAPAHYNLGNALRDQKKLDEAIACYREAIELDPKYVSAHINLGHALRDQEKLDDAIYCYRKAIELDPKYANSHIGLGNVLHDQKKLDEAFACYRKAIELDPKSALAYTNFGNVLRDLKMADEAIAAYRVAIELDPNNILALNNLGLALRHQSKLDEAIACYKRAIEIDPKDTFSHINLGSALRAQKKLDAAIASYRKAIELDPKYAPAHYNLSGPLRDQKKFDEAAACLQIAIELDPKYAVAHARLGQTLYDQRKVVEAIACYKTAIELDAKSSITHNSLGIALRAQKKLDEAIACYKTAIELDPTNVAPHFNLGIALSDQNKLPEAIAAYRKAVELDPSSAMAHFNLGNALADLKELGEAVVAYHKAIELDPKYIDAHNNLGLALKRLGKLPEAIAAYNKAIELNPKYTSGHYNLGIALKHKGETDNAIAAFKKAIELDPIHVKSHIELGAILCDVKVDYDGAIAAFRKAIELDPKSATAHINLGRTLRRQKKVDDAIASFKKAIELDAKHFSAHIQLGAILCDVKGDFDGAITVFRKAIELDPKSATAHYNLGAALERLRRLDEAIYYYRKAIELDPKYPDARKGIGYALAKKGWDLVNCPDPKRALALGKEAVEAAPTSSFVWQQVGWVQYRAGEWTASIETLEKSCKLQDGGTGDGGQWIVLSLAHGKLANKKELPEHERAQHMTNARHRYDQAAKWIDSRPAEEHEVARAIRAFRAEAAELLGVTEKQK